MKNEPVRTAGVVLIALAYFLQAIDVLPDPTLVENIVGAIGIFTGAEIVRSKVTPV